MVNFAGKYEHVKNENLKEFSMAVSNDAVYSSKVDEVKTTIDVSGSGNEYTITVTGPAKSLTTTLKAGAEFDDPLPNGTVLKSTASIEGNKIIVKSKHNGADVGGRTYTFGDNDLLITLKANSTPIQANRYYKRV